MKRTKEMKKEWIAELKKMQKSYQGEISPDDLPFDLTAELGEVVTVELKSPGVYYIATKKAGDIPECPEVYVVTADAPAISEKAWTYGQEFPGHPDLRVYDILQPKSGRYIIDFEMRRYQMPPAGNRGRGFSIYCRALWSGRTSGLFWRFPCSFLYSKRVHCTA